LEELEVDLDRAKRGKPPLRDSDGKVKKNQNPEAWVPCFAFSITKSSSHHADPLMEALASWTSGVLVELFVMVVISESLTD
jgi:hypothetical protein